jgi:3',5'-nucleoside bisphosphate phosphatase
MGWIDLHLHSTHSDGVLAPEALVAVLKTAGIRVCALTDHDTVAGTQAMQAAAARVGITSIAGIELSAEWCGRSIHIVGLGFDPDAAAIVSAVTTRTALRRDRAAAIADRLERAGAPGRAALEHLVDVPIPTRTHFARSLVALGAASDVASAFNRWLAKGKPGYVSTAWPSVESTVTEITAAGGTAVLAHPLRYTLSAGQRRTLVREFAAAGGRALEVVTGGMAAHQIETATGLCLRANLEGSIGSDCHDPALPWHRPGHLATLPASVTPVWHRWVEGGTQAPGA